MSMTDAARQAAISAFDWAGFIGSHWGKGPILFKNPFGRPPLGKEDLFQLLVRHGDALRAGRPASVVLFDRNRVGQSGQSTFSSYRTELAGLLPSSADGDMDGFVARLARDARFGEFGIYMDNAQRHERAFAAMRDVLREAYQHIPMPSAPLNIDVFMGNYASTAFGVHRDPLDNIMFMIAGGKTMRLWSDEVWKRELGNPEGEGYSVHDYARFLPKAQTFALEEGDMLYWPHTYWHVGENVAGFSASINLDFKVAREEDSVDPCLESAYLAALAQFKRRMRRRGPAPAHEVDPRQAQRAAERIPEDVAEDFTILAESLLARDDMDLLLHARWLVKLSSFGFNLPIDRRAPRALADSDSIRADPRYPILFAERDGRTLMSHSGHLKISRGGAALRAMIEAINSGARLRVGELLDRGCGEGGLEREAARRLIEEFYQIWAVDAATQ